MHSVLLGWYADPFGTQEQALVEYPERSLLVYPIIWRNVFRIPGKVNNNLKLLTALAASPEV
jgi:hypothetical protein